jgi:hypothetical protein
MTTECKTKKVPLTPRLIARALNTNRFILERGIERKRTGRPRAITQEVIGKLEYAFAFDSTIGEACLYAGISPDTYYTFCKQRPDFSERITALRCAPNLMARMTVVAAVENDADLALKYLERKRPQEFSMRMQIHLAGEVSDRHSVNPETIRCIRSAMGNFASKGQKMRR